MSGPSKATPNVAADLVALTPDPLDVGALHDAVVTPGTGAVVVFSGTVRDHAVDPADGSTRDGVVELTYEAWETQALERMRGVVAELRRRWPSTERVALVHRTGTCRLGEPTVIVAVATPHRPDAFEAARFGIDALKASVPIWKHETWDGGADWSPAASDLVDPSEVGSAAQPPPGVPGSEASS